MLKSDIVNNLMALLLLLQTGSALCAQTPEKPTTTELDRSMVTSQIDVLMQKYYPADEPGAALIVVRNNRVIFRKAYGMADLQLDCAMEPGMCFKLGSVTKQFTAVAIMRLVEQEKVSLADPLTAYFPEFPQADSAITIRHLLTHTSGFDDYIDFAHIREDVSLQDQIAVIREQERVAAPGEKFHYSNPNYILLGRIIEIVSGRSYADYLQQKLFEPLKMTSTRLGDQATAIPGLVSGYRQRDGQYINAPYMSMTHPWSAGGLVSNVDDLARWQAGLRGGKLISLASLKQCFTAFTLNSGESAEYGYGWFVDKWKGRYKIAHGGGVFGFVNHCLFLPQEGLYVALLSNRIVPDAVPGTEGIAEMVAAIAIGEPFELPDRTAITMSEDELQRYAGLYRIEGMQGEGPMAIRRIMVENEHVYFGINVQRRIEIYPESKSLFFIPGVSGTIRFEFEENGKVERLIQDRSDGSELVGMKAEEK